METVHENKKNKIHYCKSTIFGRYKIWRLGQSRSIWRNFLGGETYIKDMHSPWPFDEYSKSTTI